jgi:hypothetical protein
VRVFAIISFLLLIAAVVLNVLRYETYINFSHYGMFYLRSVFDLTNYIGGVMIAVLTSSAVDRGFDPRLGKTNDYKIGISCFMAMNTTLRNKNKDRLDRISG